jgi:ATP-dependent helicase HrpB
LGTSLPIDDVLPKIQAALRTSPSLVIRAPPGAGKTTRVPGAILDSPDFPRGKKILMLEPRRIAARLAAKRIAQERNVRLGQEVGYRVRFEDRTSAKTRLMIITEGLLTRMLHADPMLEDVACVILDEFHERSIHADLALAFLKEIQQTVRPDLKIIVMSATLALDSVSAYLDQAPVIDTFGRAFPVEEHWAKNIDSRDELQRCVGTVKRAIQEIDHGDLLVFLPGAREIQRVQKSLNEAFAGRIDVLPLYGALSPRDQDLALSESKKRKIVVATNIAESSVTIPGVHIVVDVGREKLVFHDPARGLERLDTVRISRASAEQRAGRAGRLGPGHVFRLWSEAEHRHLQAFAKPEIERIDLASALLEVLAWAERDPALFDWFDAPSDASLQHGLRLLRRLGAVDRDSFKITKRGRQILNFPLHPRMASALITAHTLGALEAGSKVCALFSEPGMLKRGRRDEVSHCDFDISSTYLPAPIRQAQKQLLSIALKRLGPEGPKAKNEEEAIQMIFLSGFSDRVARRRDSESDRFVMVGGRGAKLSRDSKVKKATLIVALDVDDGHRASEALIRQACAIEESWLQGVEVIEVVQFNAERKAAEGIRRRVYDDLVLDERRDQSVNPEKLSEALLAAAQVDAYQAIQPDKDAQSYLARIAFVRRSIPDLDWPLIEWPMILPTLCTGLRSFAQLQKADVISALKQQLGYARAARLDQLAPKQIQVDNGRPLRLRYDQDGPPVLSVRLQRLFGIKTTPRVADGRVPLKLELLAPNMRPVQVTQDLESFWAVTYPEVRKQLRARYSKHAWPEDPGLVP